jgi:5-formyltetrahydrofolate cyclo-ligase
VSSSSRSEDAGRDGPAAELLAAKAAARRAALSLRASLDSAQVAAWGERIGDRALAFLRRRSDGVVFIYLSIANEVPTRAVVEQLLREGRRVAVPLVVRGSPAMTLHQVRHLDLDLAPGIWGIPTPLRGRCAEVDPAEVSTAVVPCVAVDAQGYRIGHGGGYYDRFLTQHREVFAVGLAFDVQRVATCFPQPWDARLDALITESGLTEFALRPVEEG